MRKFIYIYICLLLSVPYGLIKLTSLYNITTPVEIEYEYLDYNFSFLLLPLLVPFFLINNNNNNNKTFLLLLLLLLCRNLWIVNFGTKFFKFTYEMILPLLFGYVICEIFKYIVKVDKFENFINFIIVIHFLGVLVSVILGLNKIDFRYNAQNLDVGSTAMIFGLIFLIKYHYFKRDFYCVLAFLLILLSGSRFPLFIVSLIFLFPLIFNFKLKDIFIITIFTIVVIPLVPSISERILSSIIELQDVSDKSSIGGRLLSIFAGGEVLKEHFFRIPFNSSSLVNLMNDYGYPTFPHSYFLNSLLFFPLIGIFIFIKFLINIFKKNNSIHIYIFITFIFYGGLIMNYKIYALLFISFYIIKQIKNNNNNEIFNTK